MHPTEIVRRKGQHIRAQATNADIVHNVHSVIPCLGRKIPPASFIVMHGHKVAQVTSGLYRTCLCGCDMQPCLLTAEACTLKHKITGSNTYTPPATSRATTTCCVWFLACSLYHVPLRYPRSRTAVRSTAPCGHAVTRPKHHGLGPRGHKH